MKTSAVLKLNISCNIFYGLKECLLLPGFFLISFQFIQCKNDFMTPIPFTYFLHFNIISKINLDLQRLKKKYDLDWGRVTAQWVRLFCLAGSKPKFDF